MSVQLAREPVPTPHGRRTVNSWYLWSVPGPEPHLGRRPLRPPLTMPAPTRSLTVADVHRYVDEQVFRPPHRRSDGRQVGIELEWIPSRATAARRHPPMTARRSSPTLPGGEPGHVRARRAARAERPRRRRTSAPRVAAMRADTAAVREPRSPRRRSSSWASASTTRGDVARVLDDAALRARWRSTSTPGGRPVAR